VVKLAKLPEMMQTEAGRDMANERLGSLLVFRKEFAQEWLGS
jgi:uncharacterized protein